MHTVERSPEEVSEIERHKYFLSEQAGHDVGWEFAAEDWEQKFANDFRGETMTGITTRQDFPEAKRGGLKLLFNRIFSK